MGKQMSFAAEEYSGKKKTTRKEKFLGEMEKVVPWARLIALIEPQYPKGKRGRPPMGVEKMLRLYFLQTKKKTSSWMPDTPARKSAPRS